MAMIPPEAVVPFAASTAAYVLGLVFDVALLVLAIVAMLAVLKIPPLLERVASQHAQSQQVLREVLAEIRSVTRQG